VLKQLVKDVLENHLRHVHLMGNLSNIRIPVEDEEDQFRLKVLNAIGSKEDKRKLQAFREIYLKDIVYRGISIRMNAVKISIDGKDFETHLVSWPFE
jgi:hypothetical protein